MAMSVTGTPRPSPISARRRLTLGAAVFRSAQTAPGRSAPTEASSAFDGVARAVDAQHQGGARDRLGVAARAGDAGRRGHLRVKATDGRAGRHQVTGEQRSRLAEAKNRDDVAHWRSTSATSYLARLLGTTQLAAQAR